jgi:hypothetical protein
MVRHLLKRPAASASAPASLSCGPLLKRRATSVATSSSVGVGSLLKSPAIHAAVSSSGVCPSAHVQDADVPCAAAAARGEKAASSQKKCSRCSFTPAQKGKKYEGMCKNCWNASVGRAVKKRSGKSAEKTNSSQKLCSRCIFIPAQNGKKYAGMCKNCWNVSVGRAGKNEGARVQKTTPCDDVAL